MCTLSRYPRVREDAGGGGSCLRSASLPMTSGNLWMRMGLPGRTFLGVSDGGNIALIFALRYPEG